MEPQRIQLRRTKGFNLQAHSKAVNGLECVKVDRTTKWGNPWTFENCGPIHPVMRFECETAPLLDLTPLRGKNLACWCKPGAECHADILLEIANG